MGIIEIKGLQKAFDDLKVFDNLNMSISKGEVVSIIGASGCGKSVLLRSIEMLEKPDAGQIFIDGQEITAKGADIAKIRRSLGMVYQDFGLFSNMDVMDNLCIAPTKLLGMSRKDAETKALKLLETVGLADRSDASVTMLSGGQKQRVAICRCMMMNPEIILFDEPTSALDPTMVGEVLATIRMLAKRGLTMIIVTHEMSFAERISDRVIFLAEGGIYEDGTPQQIFENPQREKTIDFVRKLKHMDYHVGSKQFDLMELEGKIQDFAVKYGLSKNERYRLEMCSEEMIYELIDDLGDEPVDIDINVSFSEKDRACEMKFLCKGRDVNPFRPIRQGEKDLLDHLGLVIIDKKAQNYNHEYHDGINEIDIKL